MEWWRAVGVRLGQGGAGPDEQRREDKDETRGEFHTVIFGKNA